MLDFDLRFCADSRIFVQLASLHDVVAQFANGSFCLHCEGIAIEEDVVLHR